MLMHSDDDNDFIEVGKEQVGGSSLSVALWIPYKIK